MMKTYELEGPGGRRYFTAKSVAAAKEKFAKCAGCDPSEVREVGAAAKPKQAPAKPKE